MRAEWLTAVFSAKEAFFKCQFPITHQMLDFHDVELALSENGFRVELVLGRPPPPTFGTGRILWTVRHVVTGIEVLSDRA